MLVQLSPKAPVFKAGDPGGMGMALFGAMPGNHAWVEVEIYAGAWKVIESQSEDGLTKTYTRFYFPYGRARFLEDKNINPVSDFMSFLKMHSEITPVQ